MLLNDVGDELKIKLKKEPTMKGDPINNTKQNELVFGIDKLNKYLIENQRI